jgi:ABC-2 type transport system permease protein
MTDTTIMLRRNVKHTLRNPGALVMTILMPVLLLLLFVGVFGGALGAGLGASGRGHGYVDYLLAGVLMTTVGYASTTTGIAVNRDMTSGVINRFRTMAISRTSILSGHVIGSTARTLVGAVLVVAVAFLLGFHPAGGPSRWLATLGLLLLLTLALTWLAVAVGLAAKTAEGTAPFAMLVQLLPFLSSAFVPTDSISAPLRWFAAHEPFTPITDTLRALLLGTPVGSAGVVAVVWCVVLGLVGFLWARALFSRDPS